MNTLSEILIMNFYFQLRLLNRQKVLNQERFLEINYRIEKELFVEVQKSVHNIIQRNECKKEE